MLEDDISLSEAPEVPEQDMLGSQEIDLSFNLDHLTPETAFEQVTSRPFEWSRPTIPPPVDDDEILKIRDEYPYLTAEEREEKKPRIELYRKQESDKAAAARRDERRNMLLDPKARNDFYHTPEVLEAANNAESPNDLWAQHVVQDVIEKDYTKRPLVPGEYEAARDRLLGRGEMGKYSVTDGEALDHLTKREENNLEADQVSIDAKTELAEQRIEALKTGKPFSLGNVFDAVRKKHPDFVKAQGQQSELERTSALYNGIAEMNDKSSDVIQRNQEAVLLPALYLEHYQAGTATPEELIAARDALFKVNANDVHEIMGTLVSMAKAKKVDKNIFERGMGEILSVLGAQKNKLTDALRSGAGTQVDEQRDAIAENTALIDPAGQWVFNLKPKDVPGARRPTKEETAEKLKELDATEKTLGVLRELEFSKRELDKPDQMFSNKFWGGYPALLERGTVGLLSNLPEAIASGSGLLGKGFYTVSVGSSYAEQMLFENPGMNPKLARQIGYASAGVESFLDGLDFKVTSGQLGKMFLVNLRNKGAIAAFKQLVGGNLLEAGTEGLQDYSTAVITKLGQTMAHDIDPNMNVGKIQTWNELNKQWWDGRWEVQGQIFMGAFIGSGIGTWRHLKNQRDLYNQSEMKGWGLTRDEAMHVLSLEGEARDAQFAKYITSRTPTQIADAKVYRQEQINEAKANSVSTEERPMATLESETRPDGTRVWHVIDEQGNRIFENLPADVAIREVAAYQEALDREALQQQAEQAVSEEEVARNAEAEAIWEKLPAEDKTTAANIVEFSYAKPESPEQQKRLDLIQAVVAERNKKLGTKDTVQLAVADVPSTRAGQSAANFINWFQTAFGKRVQFVGSENGQPLSFTGMVAKADPNTIFLDVAGNRNILSLVGHEWSHTLEKTNPQLWASVVTQIKPLVVDWAKEMGKIDSSYDADQATPEFIANVIGDAFGDPEFWARVKQKDAGLFQRMLDAIKQWFDTITDRFSEYQTQAPDVIKDWEGIRNIVAAAMEKAREGPEEVLSDEEVRQQAQASNRRTEKGFYSKLEGIVTDKLPKSASPEQAKATINGAGIKAEEIKWSGAMQAIDRIAAENNGKVPKGDLVTHLEDEGSVNFQEVILGQEGVKARERKQDLERELAVGLPQKAMAAGMTQLDAANLPWQLQDGRVKVEELPPELQADARAFLDAWRAWTEEAQKRIPAPRFQSEDLILPGGENYREVVLAMPPKRYSVVEKDAIFARYDRGEISREERNRLLETETGKAEGNYISSHFPDVPNYVAHMRMNDRADAESKPGLFLEEIQSDRHQQGREKGYLKPREQTEKELRAVRDQLLEIQAQTGEPKFWLYNNNEEYRTLADRENGLEFELGHPPGIPDAPFRKDWPLAMFKRALRDAVALDKKWIGWTSGETQAERYDLSKQVDWISVTHNKAEDTYAVAAGRGNESVLAQADLSEEKVSSLIGKELAQKAIQETRTEGKTRSIFKGEDLKVGGEGMKGFYDKMLPNEIGKYVKQWGGKVENGKIEGIPGGPREMGDVLDRQEDPNFRMTPIWRVEITPEMRESVAKGQAQFSGRRETTEAVLPAPAPAEGPVTITAFDPALMGFAEREVQPSKELLRQLKAETRIYEQLLSCLQ